MASVDHLPGELAPKSGVYRLLNVLGGEEPTQAAVQRGDKLPGAPLGFTWRLVRETDPGDLK